MTGSATAGDKSDKTNNNRDGVPWSTLHEMEPSATAPAPSSPASNEPAQPSYER